MNVPAYHIGILKGYLSGQNAPSEVFVAAEALYMAAIQGPLRADAIEAINLVAQAAEKLMGSVQQLPVGAVTAAPIAAPPAPMAAIRDDRQTEIELPPLTRRALERASKKRSEVIEPPTEDDSAKIVEFINTKGVTHCPPLGAVAGDHEVIAGIEQPKKRKEWSPEARAAAGERMRARQAAKRSLKGQAPSLDRPIM